ncbi:MAG: hypothetical protein EB037_03485 [Actinobacteria bacterium]|nr:hypothetical protein [Actinomycetota bacterium]
MSLLGRHSTLAIAIAIAVSIPMFAALIVLLGGARWFPCGDMAQAELHMRGFLSHPPLVGAAGRIVDDHGFQGSHPGPSLWVLLYPVYALGGRSSAALMTSVVSVHLASIVAALWLVARRWGRSGALVAGFAILVLLRSSGSDFMVEPWNVWMAFFPFLVMLLLLFDVVSADASLTMKSRMIRFVVATAVGSHCVQSHVGYLVIVGAALIVAFVVLLSDARESSESKRMFIVGVMVTTLVMWSGPLVDQMRRVPGNLTILREHFGSPSEPYISLSLALRIITTQFNVVGPWLTGPHFHIGNDSWTRWPGFVAMMVFVAVSISRARGTRWMRPLLLTNIVALVGMLSILRIFGPFYEYTVRWFWILVAIDVVLGTCVLLDGRFRVVIGQRWWRPTCWAVVSATLAVSTFQTVDGLRLPGATDSRIVSMLAPQLREHLDRSDRYLVRMYDGYTLNATGFGTLLELGRSGFDAGIDPYFTAAALPHRVRSEDEVDGVLWVVVGQPIDEARLDPNLIEVAHADPRTESDKQREVELIGDIRDGLQRTGRTDLIELLERPGAALLFADPPLDPSVADEVRALIRLGQPVSVFLSEPGVIVASLAG